MAEIAKRYFPAASVEGSTPASGGGADPVQLSHAVFGPVGYTEQEKVEIGQELLRSSHLAPEAGDEDEAKRAERLGALNTHLAGRTTLLGSKPSIADLALYARIAPLVRAWGDAERTGEHGYHHIVRYVDFVQNAPVIGLAVAEADKVPIDPARVLFTPKPLDPKEEKERKKKEKAAAAGNAEAVVDGGKSKTNKAKDAVASAKDAAKGVIAGELPKREKTEKKEKPAKQPKQPAAPKEIVLSPALIDLRVGHILKAENHPNADSLYVSTIAVGDAPGTENTSECEGQVVRTVCSGLNGLVPLAEMQGRKIVAVCNLKPVTMRGVKSCAMVLAASPRDAEAHAGPVELVSPPEGAVAGQRIWFEGWEGEPEGVLNPKKKVWDYCQLGFTTTDDLGVAFEKDKVEQLKGQAAGKPALARLRVKDAGYCTVKTLKGATVR